MHLELNQPINNYVKVISFCKDKQIRERIIKYEDGVSAELDWVSINKSMTESNPEKRKTVMSTRVYPSIPTGGIGFDIVSGLGLCCC